MNKSIIFLTSILIIAITASTKLKTYTKIANNLYQLNKALGKDNVEFEILISKISSAFSESHAKFNSFYSGLHSRCTSGTNLLKDYIKMLESDKVAAITAIHSAEELNMKIKIDRRKLKEDFDITKVELTELKKQIAKTIESIKVSGAEAETKLTVIETLKNIINDELMKPTKGTSFVQLETFHKKLKEFKLLMKNSHDFVLSPITTTLIALAERKGFSDQKIIRDIMKLLENLENNLRDLRHKQEIEGKSNVQHMKEQAKEKINQLKSYSKMAADANSKFAQNEEIIKTSQIDQDELTMVINRKIEELKNWTNICDNQDVLRKAENLDTEKIKSLLEESMNSLLDL